MELVNVANEAIVLNKSFHLWNGSCGYELLSELGEALEERLPKVDGYKPFTEGNAACICELYSRAWSQYQDGEYCGEQYESEKLYFTLLDSRVKVQITERLEEPDGDVEENLKYEGLLEIEELKALLSGLTLYHDHLREEMDSEGLLMGPEDIMA